MTKLVNLTGRIEGALKQAYCGQPVRLIEARKQLLTLLLTAGPADALLSLLNGQCARDLGKHAAALSRDLVERSFLPEALCAHYRYGQSQRRVKDYYRIHDDDWQLPHRLAASCGVSLAAFAREMPYDEFQWHDELERRTVSVQVVLDTRALDDILLCALEAYVSPRRRKGYEIYGITLGMHRDVPESKRGCGRIMTRYISIMRAQPQLSAVGGPRHVEPNARSLDALTAAAATLFPQHQLLGDFHSHLFNDFSDLQLNTGWQPSDWDANFSSDWIHQMRQRGHDPQVDLVIAIARTRRRVQRTHYRGMPHTLQTSIGEYRIVLGAYRILRSGYYATDAVSLSVPGLAD